MDNKTLLAILDSIIEDAIKNIVLPEGIPGPRGLKGKDGNEFDLEFHKQSIIELIENHSNIELTVEQLESLQGKDGIDGKDGQSVYIEDVINEFTPLILNRFEETKDSLKLKFSDLSEEEKDGLRGPRGQRGKPGKDFVFEDCYETIRDTLINYISTIKQELKLNFSDLTFEEKESLKIKFSDLNEEEKLLLKGSRGQRGKPGADGENGLSSFQLAVESGFKGTLEEWITSLKGEIGPRGVPGLPGVQGVRGLNGLDGIRGLDGEDGEDAPIIEEVSIDADKKEFNLIFDMSNGEQLKTNKVPFPKTVQNNFYSSGGSSSSVAQALTDMSEPTGFQDRSESLLTFDAVNRILTLTPKNIEYYVYVKSKKLTIGQPVSIQIPNTTGDYYFYINEDSELKYSNVFGIDLLYAYAYVSYIYWSSSDNNFVSFGEERHGIVMDHATWRNLHSTRGTQIVAGGNITYSLGNGNTNTSAQISLSNIRIADEDIVLDIENSDTPTEPFEQKLTPIAYLPILYRSGVSEWRKKVSNPYPMVPGTIRCQYNFFNGTNWVLQDATLNNKVLVTYVFGTTNIFDPVIGILGQTQYQNVAEARSAAVWSSIDFGSLPSPEMKLLYILYYETSSSYNNVPKARIVAVEDFRATYDKPNTVDPTPIIEIQAQGNTVGSASKINFKSATFTVEQSLTNPDTVEVTTSVDDYTTLYGITCDLSVYIGSAVRITAGEIAVNGMADSYENANVIGIVEAMPSTTTCNIRLFGRTLPIYVGLDLSKEYYLSDITPGQITDIVPTTSGHIKLKLGQPYSDTRFIFIKGERVIRG